MRKSLTFRIALAASMAALAIVLDYASLHTETTKFTLYGFPLLLTGYLFGSLTGGLAGLTVGFVSQLMSGYGFSISTPLWMLAPLAWGLVSGILAHFLSKKRLSLLSVIMTVVITSLSCTVLNTAALYIERKFILDLPSVIVFSELGMRVTLSVFLCIPYVFGIYGIISRLKDSSLVELHK